MGASIEVTDHYVPSAEARDQDVARLQVLVDTSLGMQCCHGMHNLTEHLSCPLLWQAVAGCLLDPVMDRAALAQSASNNARKGDYKLKQRIYVTKHYTLTMRNMHVIL